MKDYAYRKRYPTWSWTQFVFGLALGAAINFLALNTLALSLWAHLVKVAAVAIVCGLLAGRFGDRAWNWILAILRFHP